MRQLVNYALIGGFCSLIDFFSYLIISQLEVLPIYASGTSFIVAAITNYYLSIKFAFSQGRHKLKKELIIYIFVNLTSLFIHSFIFYCYELFIGENLFIGKIFAIILVFFWNYLSRKYLVFHAHSPM